MKRFARRDSYSSSIPKRVAHPGTPDPSAPLSGIPVAKFFPATTSVRWTYDHDPLTRKHNPQRIRFAHRHRRRPIPAEPVSVPDLLDDLRAAATDRAGVLQSRHGD